MQLFFEGKLVHWTNVFKSTKKKKIWENKKKVNRTVHDTALCEYPLEGVYHNR